MRLVLALAVLALSALAAPAARADDTGDAIAAAKEYYEDGKLAKSAKELQFAIGDIWARLAAAYQATLPPAPDGWAYKDSDGKGFGMAFAGGQVVERKYDQKGGKGRAEFQLAVDSPLTGMATSMFSNPMMASQMGYARARIQGEDAMAKFDSGSGEGDIWFQFGTRGYAHISGKNLPNEDFLKDLAKAWDYDEFKDAAGL